MKIELFPKFLSWECNVNGIRLPFYFGSNVMGVIFSERQYAMLSNRFIYESRLQFFCNDEIPYSIWDNTGHVSDNWELVATKSHKTSNYWTLSSGTKIYEYTCPKHWRNENGHIMLLLRDRKLLSVPVLTLFQRTIVAYAKNSFINRYPVLIPIFLMSFIET
jgi:uncharacterized protein YbdZ (MbtH family)